MTDKPTVLLKENRKQIEGASARLDDVFARLGKVVKDPSLTDKDRRRLYDAALMAKSSASMINELMERLGKD